MTYLVTADIRYLDGNLKGLTIPAGYSVTMPDEGHALRVVSHLERVKRTDDFVRAAVTGNRYKIIAGIHYAPMMPIPKDGTWGTRDATPGRV